MVASTLKTEVLAPPPPSVVVLTGWGDTGPAWLSRVLKVAFPPLSQEVQAQGHCCPSIPSPLLHLPPPLIWLGLRSLMVPVLRWMERLIEGLRGWRSLAPQWGEWEELWGRGVTALHCEWERGRGEKEVLLTRTQTRLAGTLIKTPPHASPIVPTSH